jgi:hypothetical protein
MRPLHVPHSFVSFSFSGLTTSDYYHASFFNPDPESKNPVRLSDPNAGVFPNGYNIVSVITPSFQDEAPVNSSVSLWHKEIIGSSQEVCSVASFLLISYIHHPSVSLFDFKKKIF